MKVGDLVSLIREQRDYQNNKRVGIIFDIDETVERTFEPDEVWVDVLWVNVYTPGSLRTCTSTRYLEVISESR